MSLRHALAFLVLALPSLAGQGFSSEGTAALKAALDKAITAHQTPGAVVWMEHAGKAGHWAQGKRALVPEPEAMTEDTVFDAASLTKVVATTPSVMLLIEQGKVDLLAPVQRYIPEFIGSGKGEITVRDLLTHVSGLIPDVSLKDPWQGYDEGIRLACACAPDPAPGRQFRYSDVNFLLLGEIIRRVSGQPLDAYAAAHVFAPLGMKDTGFNPPASLRSRIAPTEKDEKGIMLRGVVHDPTARRMGGVAGHAGLFTTAHDLARYARLLLNGEVDGVKLFKAATLALMEHSQTPLCLPERRGLGWDMDSKFSRPRGLYFGEGSFGHTGFTGTAMWIDPASKTFYVLLTTRLHPTGKGDVRDLYEETGTLVAKAAGLKTPRVDSAPDPPEAAPPVLNGIDVLEKDDFAPLRGLRLGLVTNHTGIDARGRSTLDLLAHAHRLQLRALFSPEHGIRGELDQEKIDDSHDAATGLPVFSLYGKRSAPSADEMSGLDALVFDIQDIGCRFYTYIGTMKNCLEAAAKAHKKFIVLDRVNPIRADKVEGPVVVAKHELVACANVPLRHGMTAGELARMFNTDAKADLSVIQIQGWHRDQWFDATGLPWLNPSPNMRSLTAATVYPGVGLLEYAISVGRGTDAPFELVGAPYVNGRLLAHEMNALALPGIRFLPQRFIPAASVFEGQPCGGVRLIVTDREALRPVRTGLALGHTLHRLYPKDFNLEKFNRLLLDPATIEGLKTGAAWQDLEKPWLAAADAFVARRQTFLLYP